MYVDKEQAIFLYVHVIHINETELESLDTKKKNRYNLFYNLSHHY